MPKYHMYRKDREMTDPEELKQILKKGKYVIIAMCRNQEPYIVTLNYGYDERGHCLVFHCALKGLKLDFIAENPEVCASVILDEGYVKDNCSHRYMSLVIRGKMALIRDLEEKKQALDILLNHLEENPAPIKARNIKDNASYDRFAMLKLEISELTGKKGS
jgi:hypothetical protein